VLELMPDGDALDTRVVECSRPLINPPILPITMGLIGSAARTGETVVVQDVRADPRHVPAEGWDTQSELCVPIVTRHGLWGILNLESNRKNAFPPRLVQVAEIVAQQLALAVENTA